MRKINFQAIFLLFFLLTACENTKNKSQEDQTISPASDSKQIIFKGSGDTDNWSIKVFSDNSLNFDSDGEIVSVRTTGSIFNPIMEGIGISFQSDENDELIRLDAFIESCNNKNYSSIVLINKQGVKDFYEYTGCGEFYGDNRLHGDWTLKTVNKKDVFLEEKIEKYPTLKIDIKNKKVSGSASCNKYSGEIIFGYKSILFKQLISTKKLCSYMDLEDVFLNTLSENKFDYTIEDQKIVLKQDGQTILEFIKVE